MNDLNRSAFSLTKSPGFTLVELMVVVAIAAILASLAAPAIRDMVTSHGLSSRAELFKTSLNFARTESVRHNSNVSLCPSQDGLTCGGSWAEGWIVFSDPDADNDMGANNCAAPASDCLLSVGHPMGADYLMVGNTPSKKLKSLAFSSRGLHPGTKAEFHLTKNGEVKDRRICVDISGRSRILIPTQPGQGAPACP